MRKSYVSEFTESSSEVSESYSMSDSIMLRSSFEAILTSSKASAGFCTKAIVFLRETGMIWGPPPSPAAVTTSVSDYRTFPSCAATLMLSKSGDSSLLSLLFTFLFLPSAGEMVFLRCMDCLELARLFAFGSSSGPKRLSLSFCRHSTVTSIAT